MKLRKYIIILFLFLSVIIISFIPNVNAAENDIDSSSVILDLEKSDNFDIKNYPENIKDVSIDVLTVSFDNQLNLYLYTYAPAAQYYDLTAQKASMYFSFTDTHEDINFKLYSLDLISSNGVFSKYQVRNFKVLADKMKYINISEIFRKPIPYVDKVIENGTTDYKAFEVAKQWKLTNISENKITVDCVKFDVVDIEVKINGYILLKDGISWGDIIVGVPEKYCKAHLIGFDIENYDVTRIYDASLSFIKRKRHYETNYSDSPYYPLEFYENIPDPNNLKSGQKYSLKSPQSCNLKISDIDKVSFSGDGIFSKTYNWNRISRSDVFVDNFKKQGIKFFDSNDNVSNEDLLKESEFIFAFTETYISFDDLPVQNRNWCSVDDYVVANVAILRLHFIDLVEGELNLGVVGDITTGSDKPLGVGDSVGDELEKILEFLKQFLKILLFILFIILIVVVVANVIPVFNNLFTFSENVSNKIKKTINQTKKYYSKNKKKKKKR